MGSKYRALLLTVLLPATVFAQTNSDVIEASDESSATTTVESTVEIQQPKNNRNIEKMEVTGSYIRRSDIEGPSPVVTIDRATIEASGFNNVGQLLRADTSSPFGADGETVNLRGLGTDRTLVLINGQRAPRNASSYGAQGSAVNMVPLAAVERIDIMKDGASATYGSEAIGGVVNIITRKNIDGVAFATKYDLSEPNGGDVSRTSVAYAKNTGKSSFLTSLQYTHRQGFRNSDFTHRNGTQLSENFAPNFKTSKTNNKKKAAPSCPSGQVNDSNGACVADITPMIGDMASNEFAGIMSYNYELSGDTEIYTTFIGRYNQDNSFLPGSSLRGEAGTSGFKFTGAEAQKLAPQISGKLGSGDYSTNDDITLYGALPNLRQTKEEQYMGGLIVGTKGYWGNSDWGWDVSLNNQYFQNHARRQGIGLRREVREAVLSGQINTLTNNNNINTAGLTVDAVGRDRYQVNWLNAVTNGSLGDFMGGTWSTALGVSAAHFEYRENSDDRAVNGAFLGLVGADAGGERQLYAGYTELSGMFANKFETQLALRFDQYSDFGNTLNPKLAFRYQPFRSLTMRTSVGTGFNAPSLQQAYGPNLEAFYNGLFDPLGCSAAGNDQSNTSCQPLSVSARRDSNADLKEETSLNFNFGVIYEPVKRLSIALDYWRVRVDDVVFGGDPQKLLEMEAQGIDVSKYNAQIIRDGSQTAERIELGLTNAGTREVDGLDATINYLMKTRVGDFNFSTTHSYLFSYTEAFYEEYGREQVLGQGSTPRWRNVSSIGYKQGWFGSQVVARTTSRVEREARALGKIEQFTQFDINFDFDLAKNSRLQIGAINAFDQQPALDPSNSTIIETDLYRPVRVTYLGYRQDF